MKYILKPEFKGVVISRNKFGFGQIIFNAETVQPNQYENYYKLGFEDLFDVVNDEIKQFELVGDGEITAINLTDNPIMPGVTFSELDNATKKAIDYQGVVNDKPKKKKK